MKSINWKVIIRKILLFATAAAMVVYFYYRIFYTLPLGYGFVSMIAAVFLLIAEILSSVQVLDKYGSMEKSGEPELPEIPEDWYPDVDVFIATHNESVDILFKTANACTFMEYPDKEKVHIYICDDNNRPEMAAVAKNLKVGYFGLAKNKLLKAGNLNNALVQTHSPLVVTFDADMIPTRKMLVKTIPYFFLPRVKKLPNGRWVPREQDEIDENYKIGFVQTPQSFYNPDLFQFNLYSENRIPNEQDYFFREVNVIRNSSNAPIYAGSNTIISRKALEEINYIATGTITEDFETGLKIQRNGWTTFATSTPLAHGLAPDAIDSLLNQRERWGRGCVQSLHKLNIMFMKDLPLTTKLSYLSCYAYWWTFLARFLFITSPILFTVFRLRIVECNMWQFLAVWAPYFILHTLTIKQTAGATRNQHWNGVIDTIIFPYIIGPVVLEAIGVRLKKFAVTRKDKVIGKAESTILYALPHILLFLASVVALLVCVSATLKSAAMYNIIIMYWLVINCKNLILSIFFMQGRDNIRQTERFYVEIPIEIPTSRGLIRGHTLDISEEGMALVLPRPEYISPDTDFGLIISDAMYRASMRGKITHVEQRGDKMWKYCVLITQIDTVNHRQYYQIIYDRHHSLPDKIVDNWSIFDDYNLNMSKRSVNLQAVQRKLPRIKLNIPITLKSGVTAVVESFNYRYITIRIPPSDPLSDDADSNKDDEQFMFSELIIDSRPDLAFKLKYESQFNGKNVYLYYIENWEDLLDAPDYSMLVDEWISAENMPIEALNVSIREAS